MHDILNEPISSNTPSEDKLTVRIAILVDESGSMLGASAATVDSLNSYLDEQATREEPIVVSVYTFNSNSGVRNRFRSVNAKTSPRMFRNNDLFENKDLDKNLIYAPTGGTPLHDAIASVISQETTGIPTLVVILTDGFENQSVEYRTVESIQTLINQQEGVGWNFVYLMAGLSKQESDAYTSRLMGRSYSGATMAYAKGAETEAFRGLVASTSNWELSNRVAASTGKTLDATVTSQNFFNPSSRDIKKPKKK